MVSPVLFVGGWEWQNSRVGYTAHADRKSIGGQQQRSDLGGFRQSNASILISESVMAAWDQETGGKPFSMEFSFVEAHSRGLGGSNA